jgi:glycosyltransferase involved in cell wall biosynthesis
LPFALYRIKAERYLFFAYTSPILFRRKGIYNTIHDMGAWDAGNTMKPLQRFYWKATSKVSLRVSEGVITVSEFSKGRIADILSYPADKIRVIPSAIYKEVVKSEEINFEDVKEIYKLPKRYIMTLSTLEPRKNLKLLLEAFALVQNRVDYDLVLVGRKGWMMDEVLQQYNAQSRIHITGFVEDGQVATIYKNAMCFVFPSLYEGFGLPPVEALAVGTPVISSDAASMPEVLRNQAVYFKNDNLEELKGMLLHLEENISSMPRELDEYQKENYSFKISARKVLEFIEK